MFSWNKNNFSKQVGVIIPTDFYDIRAATPPKAGWNLMFITSILIYTAAIIAFTLLFSYESGRSTVETIVVADDRTGTGANDYTCQMISRVTASYQSPSYGYPALAYNLVNVMESQKECKSNMAATSPCDTPMLYYPGTVTALSTGGDTFGAAAMFGANLVYVFSSKSAFSNIISYDYSRGQYNTLDIASNYNAQPNTLAVDRNGYPIYVSLQYESRPVLVVCRAFFGDNTVDTINFDTGSSSVLVFNDNLYNIYYATNESFYALDVYTSPAVSTLLFNLTAGETLLYAAVYNNGTSPTVYYWTSSGQIYTLYCFNHDVTTTLLTDEGDFLPGGVTVDGLNNLYIVQDYSNGYYVVMDYHPNEEDPFPLISFLETTTAPSGVSIDPLGERIIFLYRDFTQKQTMSFFYTQSYNSSSYNLYSPEEVKVMNGFGATWFTCGDKLFNSTEYTPGAVAEYPEFCPNNGVAGKVVYKNAYTFTSTDSSAYAVENSAYHCPALIEPICTMISDLPPYSCTRTLEQSFFASAATAFANAQFVVQILILIGAIVLPFTVRIFPIEPRSNSAVNNAPSTDPHHDIELTVNATQDNPMR